MLTEINFFISVKEMKENEVNKELLFDEIYKLDKFKYLEENEHVLDIKRNSLPYRYLIEHYRDKFETDGDSGFLTQEMVEDLLNKKEEYISYDEDIEIFEKVLKAIKEHPNYLFAISI